MNRKMLLLGDEAVAQGALDAGLSGVYAYPGTPSTEITEFIQHHAAKLKTEIHHRWAANEKTAMEAALGMSFAGKRALVCMKHVGMNVCADAFVNSAFTGANGGLVVVAADDPSMHSSQNEQDSRFYGNFAFIPTFEPDSQQQAYDMTRAAFDFSEQHQIPVLLRLTTRMAHSRAVVECAPQRPQNTMRCPDDTRQWVLMPANSRVRYGAVLEGWAEFEKAAATSPFNVFTDGPDRSTGIVACGIAANYVFENFPEGCPYPMLRLTQYPLPRGLVGRLAGMCGSLLVLEDGQPVVESALRGLNGFLNFAPERAPIPVRGRLNGDLPRMGELTPDNVRGALGLAARPENPASEVVVARPPALCAGCGHRDVFVALNEVLRTDYAGKAKVFSDIGCYSLGWLSPLHAIDTVVEMGASITMAKGAADAGVFPAVAIIGDSTFTHSGMTGLLDAVNGGAERIENGGAEGRENGGFGGGENSGKSGAGEGRGSNITVVISDNLTTGMTGGQDSAGTGRLEQICEGIGVAPEHIRVVVPLPKNMERIREIIRQEIAYDGISVIIPRRECIQTLKRRAGESRGARTPENASQNAPENASKNV